MKKTALGIGMILTLAAPATGYTVYCSNCSTITTQLLERATGLDQLAELATQTQESIQQTTQQISMVQHAIKNTQQLPSALRSEYASQLTQLARLTNQLNTHRADAAGIARTINSLYPDQSAITDLIGSGNQAQANQQFQTACDNWSQEVDNSTLATYQVSGQQLKELEDSGQLEDHVNGLLNTPEGQMQAIQSGNQLAALQISEQRQLRELLATQAQAAMAAQAKAEKKEQVREAWWREATAPRENNYSEGSRLLPRPRARE
jgi:P-type conjugative transfer protein TrbJ